MATTSGDAARNAKQIAALQQDFPDPFLQIHNRNPLLRRTLSEDAFLPSQYNDLHQRRVLSHEQLLLVALVKQSERDLDNFRRYDDARAWFLSKDLTYPLSFSNVCQHLGVSPRMLRRAARQHPRPTHRLVKEAA